MRGCLIDNPAFNMKTKLKNKKIDIDNIPWQLVFDNILESVAGKSVWGVTQKNLYESISQTVDGIVGFSTHQVQTIIYDEN